MNRELGTQCDIPTLTTIYHHYMYMHDASFPPSPLTYTPNALLKPFKLH